jgi:hypothetical protein
MRMPKKRVRIRSKRLDQLDEDKLALAVWLIARDLVDDKTSPAGVSEVDVHNSAGEPT